MKNNAILLLLSGLLVLIAGTAHAEEKTLSKDDAITLFNDKTFDGEQLIKNKKFRVYSGPDGSHEIHFSGGKIKKRYWRINDKGEHCVSKRKDKAGRCSKVVDAGNGVYHKITKGKHTHTLRNFVKGNQL